MERKMTKRFREKMSMALLDACLLVAEDGQRPDAGEFVGYGSKESRCEGAAAALVAWTPAALRQHNVGNLSPAMLAVIRRIVATAIVSQCDIDATLVQQALTDRARQQQLIV
jgi:hypothetical protein